MMSNEKPNMVYAEYLTEYGHDFISQCFTSAQELNVSPNDGITQIIMILEHMFSSVCSSASLSDSAINEITSGMQSRIIGRYKSMKSEMDNRVIN